MGGGQAAGEVCGQPVVDEDQEVCEHLGGDIDAEIACRALAFKAIDGGLPDLGDVVLPAGCEVWIGPDPPGGLHLHAQPSRVAVNQMPGSSHESLSSHNLGGRQSVLFGKRQEQRVLVREVVEDRAPRHANLGLQEPDRRPLVAVAGESLPSSVQDAPTGRLKAVGGHAGHPPIMQTVRSYCQASGVVRPHVVWRSDT